MKTKISEVDELLEQMRSQVCANKQSESYSCLVSDSLEVKGKGKANRRDHKAAKNRKRNERRKIEDKKRFCDAIESRKQYIKNLSNEQLTDEQITLVSRGFKFIPTLVAKENLIRRQLLADFNQFARRMRLLLMSRQDKLNEGQVLLDDLNNYRPLDKPMVETTTKKAQQLIKTLLSEGTLMKRRLNGSPLRLILRESQCFTHLLKSTNRHLSEDLLSQGVPDLQNGSQHLLTTLFSQ